MKRLGKSLRYLILPLIPLGLFLYQSLQTAEFRPVLAGFILGHRVGDGPCRIEPGRKFSIDYYGGTYFGDSSTLVDQWILCYGAWSPGELAFLRDAAELRGGSESVFVDVGANSGAHSLFVARHAGVVHAFEPYPPVLERFERSIAASAIDNIVIHRIGLGDRDAELAFEEPPPDNVGTGSFVRGLMPQNQHTTTTTLRVVEGDRYFREQGVERVDVFKIDTEGFERPILLGLRETFAANRPIGTFELTQKPGAEHRFVSEDDLRQALPPDYRLFNLRYETELAYSLEPFRFDFSADEFQQESVVAIPAEEVARFVEQQDSAGLR